MIAVLAGKKTTVYNLLAGIVIFSLILGINGTY